MSVGRTATPPVLLQVADPAAGRNCATLYDASTSMMGADWHPEPEAAQFNGTITVFDDDDEKATRGG
jgi:hypothetical protein